MYGCERVLYMRGNASGGCRGRRPRKNPPLFLQIIIGLLYLRVRLFRTTAVNRQFQIAN